jgi:hypothetical protein
MSPAVALDRYVGTSDLGGVTTDLTVLVEPGVGASWTARFRNVVLASGPLAAFVSGSTVEGILFITGGVVVQDPLCCRPCRFTGTITGNRVDAVFDEASCGGPGTFVLTKQ